MEQCSELLTNGAVCLDKLMGGEYALEDFAAAFAALKDGAPGKMLFRLLGGER